MATEPKVERKASANPTQQIDILDRLQSAASKSRVTFDGAIEDFRNRFTVGSTQFNDENDH
ncbi:hypothetical protein [Rhizobium rosettiformans]|uniref:hypothetical protein n=1 Tax=Rhizobium rosettiformans TaxID=1368430 RepID=UPI0028579119|nr:hypothetical protein [Rhizobium rosettiformans]MDR7027716.1 hypothetical protein [Rhizobium rosettiformans]MDR7066280.1 hypothetical protein [Rhizobium rosettiformans]